MTLVLGGELALGIAIALAPALGVDAVTAALVVLFGFFFVTVSSRITGEIGSSSNPISGMTVATLLATCLLFVARGASACPTKRCGRRSSASPRATAADVRISDRLPDRGDPGAQSAVRGDERWRLAGS
jgi:uncharacterized oligopeptide transporter (OPT) family protein